MSRILLALVLALSVIAQAAAQSPEDGKPLQLGVDGEVAIDQHGAVYQHTLDTILTPEVKKLVDSAISKWRFEPVLRNGKPVSAKSNMYLTLTAMPISGGYRLSIERVRFYNNRQAAQRVAPEYPFDALRAGIGAELLVALRVNKAGDVLDVAVVQGELQSKRGRASASILTSFEKAAKAAFRKWKYEPTEDDDASDTTLLTVMSFTTGDMSSAPVGWRSADKARQNPIPWLQGAEHGFDAEGLRHGETVALGGGLKLQTPVTGASL